MTPDLRKAMDRIDALEERCDELSERVDSLEALPPGFERPHAKGISRKRVLIGLGIGSCAVLLVAMYLIWFGLVFSSESSVTLVGGESIAGGEYIRVMR